MCQLMGFGTYRISDQLRLRRACALKCAVSPGSLLFALSTFDSGLMLALWPYCIVAHTSSRVCAISSIITQRGTCSKC